MLSTFWSEEQLKKVTVTYKRCKMFHYTYFEKNFVGRDRLEMQDHTCAKNPEKNITVRKYSMVMQVVSVVSNAFSFVESTLDGMFQT